MSESANNTAVKAAANRPFFPKVLLALAGLALLALAAAGYAQGLGKLIVQKTVTGPSGYPVLANLNFPVNVACLPATTTPTQLVNNGSGTGAKTFYAAPGASCMVTELTPPPFPTSAFGFCQGQNGGTPVWVNVAYRVNAGTQSSAPPTVTIPGPAAKPVTVTVTNSWRCLPGAKGELRVRKIVEGPAGAPALTGLGFGVTASCAPAVSPATATVLANSGNISFAPYVGASCTIAEAPQPGFPEPATGFCAKKGGQPVWDPPLYVPNGTTMAPMVTIGTTPLTVLITNRWRCQPVPKAKLEVTKQIVGPPGAPPLKNLDFGVGANCNPAITPFSQMIEYGSNNNSATFIVAAGATCTVAEGTPLPPLPSVAQQFCPAGGTAIWDAPVYSPGGTTAPPTVTIGAAGASVTITNSWHCAPPPSGQVNLVKVVQGPTPNLPPMTFTINAACTPAASATSVSIATTAAGSITAPTGASCTLTEDPPLVIGAMQAACGIYSTAVWDPVAAQTFTVLAGPQTRTFTNIWKCVAPATVPFQIIKLFNGPIASNAQPNSQLYMFNSNFSINGNCSSNPSAVFGVSVQYLGPPAVVPIAPMPTGTTCNLTETTFPPFPPPAATFCSTNWPGSAPMWLPPTFSVPQPMTLSANKPNSVYIVNQWNCSFPSMPYQTLAAYNTFPASNITITKQVVGPADGLVNAMTFAVNRVCSDGLSGLNTLNHYSANLWTGLHIAFGNTSCTFTEVAPTVTPAMNAFCSSNGQPNGVAVWDPPLYPSGQTRVANGMAQNLHIVNSWHCAPSTQRVAPKKKGGLRIRLRLPFPGGGGGGGDGPRPPTPEPGRP